MGGVVTSGVLAIVAGLFVSVVLFVPFVAISYRRRGGLTAGRTLLWAGAAIYFWAIWTYTLLPLPEVGSYRCMGYNLDPLGFIPELRDAVAAGGNLLRNRDVQQLVLNVALFTPLGFFIRVLGGRGVLTSFVVGLGVSAMVEFTQLTGVWGMYPCPYRVFDVVDLETNTLGAVLGSLAALAVPGAWRRSGAAPDADRPRPVTRGRRLLAMLCDALGASLVGWTAGVAVNLALFYVVGDRDAVNDGGLSSLAADVVPLLAWLVLVLATGQSVGDLAVQLRYRGGRQPELLARAMRALGGVVGYSLLGLLPDTLPQLVFGVVAVVTVFTTREGRGLPGLLSGRALTDAREP